MKITPVLILTVLFIAQLSLLGFKQKNSEIENNIEIEASKSTLDTEYYSFDFKENTDEINYSTTKDYYSFTTYSTLN